MAEVDSDAGTLLRRRAAPYQLVMKSAFLLLLCSAAVACGGRVDPSTGGDAGPSPFDPPVTPQGFVTAAHAPLPTVGSSGGATLAHPVIVPVYFPDEGHKIDLDDFLARLPGSEYWRRTTREYGVGDVTVAPAIVSTERLPSTMTSDEVKAWLNGRFDGMAAGWPWVADPNAIYVLFFPESTTITGEMGESCRDYSAYHGEVHAGASHIVFAAIPRCVGTTVTVVDALTRSTSHELIEAATDPYTDSHRGYWITSYDHIAWTLMTSGEIADMCEFEPQSYPRLLGAFSVARGWSNAAAKAGHDPCGPGLQDEVYFNASPVLADTLQVQALGTTIVTKGVVVPKGQSRTLDVQLFSEAATDGWDLQAMDASEFAGGTKALSFTWDAPTGNNGDVRKLTIERLADGAGGGSTFVLTSRKGTATAHLWFGYAGN